MTRAISPVAFIGAVVIAVVIAGSASLIWDYGPQATTVTETQTQTITQWITATQYHTVTHTTTQVNTGLAWSYLNLRVCPAGAVCPPNAAAAPCSYGYFPWEIEWGIGAPGFQYCFLSADVVEHDGTMQIHGSNQTEIQSISFNGTDTTVTISPPIEHESYCYTQKVIYFTDDSGKNYSNIDQSPQSFSIITLPDTALPYEPSLVHSEMRINYTLTIPWDTLSFRNGTVINSEAPPPPASSLCTLMVNQITPTNTGSWTVSGTESKQGATP